MTEQRALLLKIFRSDKCQGIHRTADEIFAVARGMSGGISRATVYNNLRSMEEEGLIVKISGDFGKDYYDASPLPHGHLVCTRCHRLTDIQMPTLAKEISELIGENVESYELKIKHICRECRGA